MDFSFLPADIVSQILNFGLPAPIDIQVVGIRPAGQPAICQQAAATDRDGLRERPICASSSPSIEPHLHIDVDRTKAQLAGFTQRDVANNLLISLSGSFQTSPTYWLNPKNGVSYSIATQTPQYRLDSLQELREHSDHRQRAARSPADSGHAGFHPAGHGHGAGLALRHPAGDRYLWIGAEDAIWAESPTTSKRLLTTAARSCRAVREMVMRGQVQTMQSSYLGLISGLAFAILLVYLLIVVNFQSWLDPFIIISALPAALAGIVWFLFVTNTNISVPALTGSIMCMGVATANSILVVSFAKEQMEEGKDALTAALAAGFTRFRPVLMTALAMIIGMVPMAIGLGEGGEQNAPLGRAVIGGLIFATAATLFFVPVFFSLLHGRRSRGQTADET